MPKDNPTPNEPVTDLVPVNDAFGALAKLESELESTQLQGLEAQKRAKGLPIHKPTEFMGQWPSVIIFRKRKQTALLPETGEESEGYLILWRPEGNPPHTYYTSFIGAQVLVKDLDIVSLPLRVRLEKRGRTWQFVEPDALF